MKRWHEETHIAKKELDKRKTQHINHNKDTSVRDKV